MTTAKLPPGPPMTLGNMRANGVRRLDLHCWTCHHSGTLDADGWPDDATVVSLRPRLLCTNCGIVGADARPHWQDREPLPSLTGHSWRRWS